MTSTTVEVRDEVTGLALGLPPGWERVEAPGFPVAIAGPAGQAAADGTTFRPNVTVTVAPADDAADIRTLGTEALAAAAVVGDGAHLLAYDLWAVGDAEGRRLVAVHQQGPLPLAVTQVVVLAHGAVTTATATCGVAQLPDAGPLLDQALAGLVPGTVTR
ncbi:hypothetical protein Q9R32_00895 [Actinotalea sp. AC32]|nr:hypothetical protein [Actinotalea sp. AC32]